MIRDLTPEDYDELVDALRSARHPIPLDEEQISALAQRAHIQDALRGDIVMRQGDEPCALYFVISGQLRSADTSGEKPRLLNFHAAKAFVGEQGFLYNQPCAATVDVISDAKLAFWDRQAFNWLLGLNDQVRPYLEELYRHRERRARRPFPGKQWDEVTLIRSGKHPLMLLNALTGPVLLLLFSLGILVLWLMIGEGPQILISITVGLPVVISLLWGAYNYADWRDDEYIVTSKRVIHIERYVIYGEERDEAPLIRIQDVTVEASNLWERLLNYYDVTIQTAGAGTLVFTGIANAEQVKEVIFEERTKAMERREAADRASIRKALASRVGMNIPDVAVPVDTLVPSSGFFAESKVRRLPRLLDYLWPRMWVVQGDTVIWRKHWFVWLARTWPGILLTAILLGLFVLVAFELPPFDALGPDSWILALALGLGALISFVWYVYLYDDWHKDVYIVTSDRIVDVESSSFRLRGEERREGTFDVIQNITYSVPGFFHKLLNMGSVVIETAGTAATFTFVNVFDPSAIQQEVFNRMVAYQEKQRQQRRVREDTRTADWVGEYHLLHMEGEHRTREPTPE
ncbi:MAG: cyclic nucleotide-binding domain-containing protein [Anaerolineae bacterium]